MATLLFVHGTGVRKSDYDTSLARVQKEVRAHNLDVTVEPCLWGVPHGVKLNAEGASIPLYDSTLSPGVVVAEVEEIVLWSLLYQDPLYELRVLASAAGTTPESIPGRLKPGEELEERARQLSPDENLRRDLATLGIDVAAFNTARQKVLGEAVCREALRATPPPSTRIALPLPEQLSPGRLRRRGSRETSPPTCWTGMPVTRWLGC